jgi:hypothetical protein
MEGCGDLARRTIVWSGLSDDAQHTAPPEEANIRCDRIPRGLLEEINAVEKREMETARAMTFLVALAQIPHGGHGLMQRIGVLEL